MRARFFKRDHHMDGAAKDSILGAIDHWVVEIGELDGAFKRDVARLKGFITNDCDKVRPPYGKRAVEYDRRTVFAATVNDEQFLVDPSGNSRFWTIAVEKLDYDHDIDMQQVFAQLAVDFDQGKQWWLTPEEELQLSNNNRHHQAVSAVVERVKEIIDPDANASEGRYMTAIEVLAEADIKHPGNIQCKECGALLRSLYGPPSRVQGRDKWRVPLLRERDNRFKKVGSRMQVDPDEKFD
jgi:putative DNA primase/helicase